MTSPSIHQYTDQQISAWLRGLLTIAYADGHFDEEEQELINNLTQDELIPETQLGNLEIISAEELAKALGDDYKTKENFLRTAVMVALSNGVYSQAESDVVTDFQSALGLKIEALESLKSTLWNPEIVDKTQTLSNQIGSQQNEDKSTVAKIKPLKPIKTWLDGMEVEDPRLARFICKMVPSQCPFERDVVLFGKKIVHIPPMCKLNPLYEQLVGLRFRSLSYLADDCQEDITPYIQ